MKKTLQNLQLQYNGYTLNIPAGTPTTHQTASGIDEKYNFVTDEGLRMIKDESGEYLSENHFLWHDIFYRGLNIPALYVEGERVWLIDNSKPFDGHCLTYARNNIVAFVKGWQTVEQYIEGKDIKVVSEEEFDKMLVDFYNSMVTPWQQIDEETYDYYLEVLPPFRWHNLDKKVNIFFLSEGLDGSLHHAYIVYKNDGETKFYESIRRITDSSEKLLKDFYESINKPG